MKITYFHQYFNTPEMSGGTRSYEFARRLVAMGHEVNMITTWREQDKKKNWFVTEEQGIKVHWLPLPYSNYMSYSERFRTFITYAWHSAIKAAHLETDIVFASSTPLTIALPAIYVARKKNVPMVFEVRDLWPSVPIALNIIKNPFLRYAANFLEYFAYRNSSAIVALSPTMKKEIISKKIHSNCIAVIPNSSDILEFKYNYIKAKNFREERPWIGKKPLLVYAGTFGKVNNLSYAIRLAKALQDRNSDICILLIGDGSEREYLIREAKNKGVFENNLFFENKMTKKKITACFSAATMCANLFIDVEEMWAGSANKFFDTLAAGKPVFLNHGGWMHDLVFTHKCGLGMNGTPIDQVANHLDSAMHDVSWLRIAGQNALKLAKYFFDRDVLAEQLEKVLIATKEGNSKIVEKIAPGEYK